MKAIRRPIVLVAVAVVVAGAAYFAVRHGGQESIASTAQPPAAAQEEAQAPAAGITQQEQVASAPASAHDLPEWVPAAPEGYPERVLGSPDAPVTLIEFSSLTCPHCAAFHKEVLPKLKQEFIDTGKVRLVYRDFPLEQVALGAALVARCAPEGMYFRLLETLFSTQDQWARSQNPLQALQGYGRLAGLNEESLGACFQNEQLLSNIQQVQQTAQQHYGVSSTPSFVIDDKLHEGNRGYDYFAEVLRSELEDVGQN